MRFLADENFPTAAISALTARGSDVTWVGVAAPGATDAEVLALAAREGRILLTFDKDFGELAKAMALPPTCGVILLRIPISDSASLSQTLVGVILARDDWAGHFSVIEPGRVRMRPLGQ